MVVDLRSSFLLGLGTILTASMVGCAPEDQQRFESGARSALAQTQTQIQAAWKSANDQARHLDTSASKAELDKAIDSLKKQAVVASSETTKQAAAVRAQIDRLDLAERVQDLKAQTESKLKDFEELEQKAKQGIESSEKLKNEADQEYLKAHAELALAQKAYENATRKAQAAWDAATGS